MSVYADSSFFVSYYLRDKHAGKVLLWMDSHPSIFLTSLQRVEIAHAIYQHVFRGDLSEDQAKIVKAYFERDRAHSIWREEESTEIHYERAIELAQRYVAQLGVRTLDTLHVAAALELGATEFWSFDERQLRLAKAVGLKTN